MLRIVPSLRMHTAKRRKHTISHSRISYRVFNSHRYAQKTLNGIERRANHIYIYIYILRSDTYDSTLKENSIRICRYVTFVSECSQQAYAAEKRYIHTTHIMSETSWILYKRYDYEPIWVICCKKTILIQWLRHSRFGALVERWNKNDPSASMFSART